MPTINISNSAIAWDYARGSANRSNPEQGYNSDNSVFQFGLLNAAFSSAVGSPDVPVISAPVVLDRIGQSQTIQIGAGRLAEYYIASPWQDGGQVPPGEMDLGLTIALPGLGSPLQFSARPTIVGGTDLATLKASHPNNVALSTFTRGSVLNQAFVDSVRNDARDPVDLAGATVDAAADFTARFNTITFSLAGSTYQAHVEDVVFSTWSTETVNVARNGAAVPTPVLKAPVNLTVTLLSLPKDTTPPPAPTIARFADDTDAAGDGRTRDTTLQLAGAAEAGATVAISDAGTLLGTAAAGAGGAWTFATGRLAFGPHAFTATATDAAGNVSVRSSPFAVTVATPTPNPSGTPLGFAFRLTDAQVVFAQGRDLLIAPDGVATDVSGVATLNFLDGAVQEGDGSPLVDDLYYYARNPDVWRAGIDADQHYAQFGWREGRDPNAFFSTSDYLARNTDVAAAGIDPLQHFDQYGWHEGRSPGPDFSPEAYLYQYRDVANAGVDPLAHFLSAGQAEGRSVAAGLAGAGLIGDFDASYYLSRNPDVAAAVPGGAAGASAAFVHYLQFGAREGRDPNALFSTSYYLASNRDVAATGANPLLHYEQFGWREGRDPGAGFHTAAYLARNPDVAAAGIDPLQHYLRYGIAEGRSIG